MPRPRLPKEKAKSERLSVRATPEAKSLILREFGSIQEFFEYCLQEIIGVKK